jgi:O-antigen/teichoic acid export membrane protein
MNSANRLKPFDASGAFRPTADNVLRLAVRGAGATLFSSGLALGIQIVGTVVLARLLTPADFGVVTMVTTFSLLLVNFGVNGFTEAIIQWEKIDHALATNLFWINLAGGVVLTVAFAAAGTLLARLYRDPMVTRVTIGVSLTILITSISVVHLAILMRAMQFYLTSGVDILSRIVLLAVSIGLAWSRWGYWALVAGLVAQPLTQVIGGWYLCQWIPGLPRRVPGTAAVVRFAMSVYGRFGINYSCRNMDNLLVGWRFQAQALGFYKKAYDLFALSAGQIVAPLSHVAVAALSRLTGDYTQFKRYFLRTLGVTAFVGMGCSGYLTLIGKDLIRFLLGPKWGPTGVIFMFFGPGIGPMLIYYTQGWIHLSIGKADRWFRWGIVEFFFTGLSFLIALHWGPVGIALAWTVSYWLLIAPAFWYAGKPIDLGIGPIFGAIWKYVVASFLAASGSALIVQRYVFLTQAPGAAGALTRIAAMSVLFGISYFLMVILFHRGYGPIYQFGRLVRDMVPHKEPAASTNVAALAGASEADGVVRG